MYGNKSMAPGLWLAVLAPVPAQATLDQSSLGITRHAQRLGT